MPALLSEINTEDLATPKVRELKDALTDLLSVQQRFQQLSGNLAASVQPGVAALGSLATQAQGVVTAVGGAAASLESLPAIITAIAEAQSRLQTAQRALTDSLAAMQTQAGGATGALTTVAPAATQATAGLTAIRGPAETAVNSFVSIRDSAPAAAQGMTQIAPAAKDAQQAIAAIGPSVKDLNTALGGFQSYANAYAASAALGARATQSFKDYLATLVTGLDQLTGVSEADKEALRALNEQIKVGAEVTPEQAKELVRLSDVLKTAGVASAEAAQQLKALAAVPPPPPPIPPEMVALLKAFTESAQYAQQAVTELDQRIRLAGTGLALLTGTLQADTEATQEQVQAFNELTKLAEQGAGFTEAQVEQLQQLNEKLQQGVPLTQAEVESFRELTAEFTKANAATLGLASATETLIAQHREAQAAAQQAAAGFQLLADQLQEGASISQLQKDAFAELTEAAQQMAALSQEDKDAIAALNEEVQNATTVDAELAERIQDANEKMQEAVGATRERQDALQALIQADREATAQIREHYEALVLLSKQLTEGVTVSRQQAAALQELAQRAKEGGGFTAEQAERLRVLAERLKEGAQVTKAEATEIQNLTLQFGKANQAALGLSTSLEQTNSRVEQFVSGAQLLQGILAALLLTGFKSLLEESGNLAARIETLGVVMNIMAKNASLSTQEMRVQVEAIKRLGITTQEATDTVTQFVQANLKLADASKLARAAQDLAVVAGENSSQTLQRLVQAIQTQHLELLRAVGITTTITQVTQAYGREVGKTAKELSNSERQQAVLNFILKEAEKSAGAYEQAMSTTGKQLTSFTRYVQEAKLALGEGLVPVFGIGVRVATELLKAWIELPKPLQNLVTAGLSAATVMTALLAVMAAGKWIGIADAVVKLTTAFQVFYTVQQAGAGAATAASVAFGALNLWLTAIVAAVGLATAAWVYYNKEQEITVDAHVQAAAAREADIRSIGKSWEAVDASTKAIRENSKVLEDLAQKTTLTKAEQDRLYVATNRIEEAQHKYNRAIDSLTKLAPEAVAAIRSQSTAYADLTEGVRRAVAEKLKEAQLSLAAAQAELGRATTQRDAAAKTLEAALTNQRAIAAQVAQAEQGIRVTERVAVSAGVGAAAMIEQSVSLEELRKRQKAANDAVAAAGKPFEEARGAVDRYTQQVDALDRALDPAKQAAYNRSLVAVNLDEFIEKNKKNFQEMLRVAGTTEAALRKLNDPTELRSQLDKIDDAWRQHTAKLEAEQKRIEQAIKALRERTLGGAKEAAIFAGIQDLFDKTKVPAEEYIERIFRMKAELEKFGKSAEAQAPRFAILRQALADLRQIELTGVTPEQTKRFQELDKALQATAGDQAAYDRVVLKNQGTIREFMLLTDAQKASIKDVGLTAGEAAKMLERLGAAEERAQRGELVKIQRDINEELLKGTRERLDAQRNAEYAWAREEETLVRDHVRKLDDIGKEMFERQVVSRKNETTQAIFAEQQRAAAIIRALQDEMRARQVQLEDEKRALDQRFELRKRDIEDIRRKALEEREIRQKALEEEVEIAQAGGDVMAVRMAEARLAVFRKYNAEYIDLAEQRAAKELQIAEGQRADDQRMLDQRTALYNAFSKEAGIAMGAVAAESAAQIRRIIKDHDLLRQTALKVWSDITDTALSGFEQMLTGAKSFKDVMLDIFRSLLSTATGLLNQLVSAFVKGLAGIGSGGLTGISGAKAAVQGVLGLPQLLGGLRQAPQAAVAATDWAGTFGPAATQVKSLEEGVAALGKQATTASSGVTQASSALSKLGAGAAVAAAGGLLGFGVGRQFETRTAGGIAGGLAGAGGGAATGALIGMLGGPIGAGIGAIIGGIAGVIGGIFGGGREAREVEKARKAYIDAKGGIEAIKQAAENAGVSVDKMLSTTKAKEFQAEVQKIENGIKVVGMVREFTAAQGGMEALTQKAKAAGISLAALSQKGVGADKLKNDLDLIKGKLDLIDKAGGLANLRRQAELVGFDLKRAFDAKSLDEFNAAAAELNALLEAQQKRLNGLTSAAAGLQQMAEGLSKRVERLTKDFDSLDITAADIAKVRAGDVGGLDPKTVQQIQQFLADTQGEFRRLGATAADIFAGIIAETGDWVQAMAAVGPTLDTLIDLQDKYGLTADDTFATLLQFRQVITDNEDIALSYSGLVQVLDGLKTAGILTEEQFKRFATTAKENYDILISRGVDANQALLLAQPTLQALWEAEQELGFKADEATQALIDQGVQAGIVGNRQKDINQKILDVLVLIADALGKKVPEGYSNAARAADDFKNRAGGAADEVERRTRGAQRAMDDFGDAAEAAGQKAEDAMGAAAEGSSPTGVKQVIIRLQEAQDQLHAFEAAAVHSGETAEQTMADVARAVADIPAPPPLDVAVNAEQAAAALHGLTGAQQVTITASAQTTNAQAALDALKAAQATTVTVTADTLKAAEALAEVTRARVVDLMAQADVVAANGDLDKISAERRIQIQVAIQDREQAEAALDALTTARTAPVTAAAQTTDAHHQLDALSAAKTVTVTADVHQAQQQVAALTAPHETAVHVTADTAAAQQQLTDLHHAEQAVQQGAGAASDALVAHWQEAAARLTRTLADLDAQRAALTRDHPGDTHALDSLTAAMTAARAELTWVQGQLATVPTDQLQRVATSAQAATASLHAMGVAGQHAGEVTETAMGHAAEGHSPTGIKQVVLRLQEAAAGFAAFQASAQTAGTTAETSVEGVATAAEQVAQTVRQIGTVNVGVKTDVQQAFEQLKQLTTAKQVEVTATAKTEAALAALGRVTGNKQATITATADTIEAARALAEAAAARVVALMAEADVVAAQGDLDQLTEERRVQIAVAVQEAERAKAALDLLVAPKDVILTARATTTEAGAALDATATARSVLITAAAHVAEAAGALDGVAQRRDVAVHAVPDVTEAQAAMDDLIRAKDVPVMADIDLDAVKRVLAEIGSPIEIPTKVESIKPALDEELRLVVDYQRQLREQLGSVTGEDTRRTIEEMLDVLASKQAALEDALKGFANASTGITRNIQTATASTVAFKHALLDAGAAGEAAMTQIAEGHSPTGLRQVVVRIQQAYQMLDSFRAFTLQAAPQMEAALAQVQIVPVPPDTISLDQAVETAFARMRTIDQSLVQLRESMQALDLQRATLLGRILTPDEQAQADLLDRAWDAQRAQVQVLSQERILLDSALQGSGAQLDRVRQLQQEMAAIDIERAKLMGRALNPDEQAAADVLDKAWDAKRAELDQLRQPIAEIQAEMQRIDLERAQLMGRALTPEEQGIADMLDQAWDTLNTKLKAFRQEAEGLPAINPWAPVTTLRGGAEGPPVTVYVNYDGSTSFVVQGTKLAPAEVWNELRPQVEDQMDRNHGQYSRKIAEAVRKYGTR